VRRFDYRDLIGGVLLIAFGLFVAFYAYRYNLGTVSRMGPGMFPVALGYLLAGLGVLIILPALFRPGSPIRFELRPFIACLAAVLIFAFAITRVGMVPSIFLLTITAALADRKLSVVGILVLAVSLSLIGVLIFNKGFEMTIPLFKWDMRGY
jgi:hypothetical protein